MFEHTLTSWAQEMSSGPCDFTELRAPTSANAAQKERVARMCADTGCTPWQSSTKKLHLQRPKLPRDIHWGCPVIAVRYGAVFTKSLRDILGFLSSWQSPKSQTAKKGTAKGEHAFLRIEEVQNLDGCTFRDPNRWDRRFPNITKGVSDSRSMWLKIHKWNMTNFVQASNYCENKSEENWGLPTSV